jgi:hypothetical protein
MALSFQKQVGRFRPSARRSGYFLTVSAAAWLASCGGNDSKTSIPMADRSDASVVAPKLDDAIGPQPFADAAVYGSPSAGDALAPDLPFAAGPPTTCTVTTTTLYPRPAEALLVLDGWDFGDLGTSVVLFGKPCDDARSLKGLASLAFVTACPASPVVALARRGPVATDGGPTGEVRGP